ncbi:T9SS type A sorting domain-containing protein [bacterium]|nr:T9SS type A sorting domain-containing protein [bacterium]
MKSRFLASLTVALTLLLGLVTSNLLAQISLASSVNFTIKAYDINGDALDANWRTASGNTASTAKDTVGHAFDLKVKFETAAQNFTSGVEYTFTLPEGTVVDEAALKDGKVKISTQYMDNSNPPQLVQDQYTVTSSNITVTTPNTLDNYSDSRQPVVVVKDVNTFSNSRTVFVTLEGGFKFGENVLKINNHTKTAAQRKLAILFKHGTSYVQNGIFPDSTNFYVKNDRAASVRSNSSISSILNNQTWSAADSMYIVDRFDNWVPDYFNTDATSDMDSLTIYVPKDKGTFTATPTLYDIAGKGWGHNPTEPSTYLKTESDDNYTYVRLFQPNSGKSYASRGKDHWVDAQDSPGAGAQEVFNAVASTTCSDSAFSIIYLGAPNHGNVPGFGLKFNRTSDNTTSIPIYFHLNGKKVANTSKSLLGVSATNTATITRTILKSDDKALIGSLTISSTNMKVTNRATHESNAMLNRIALGSHTPAKTFKIVLKDKFGVPFTTGSTLDGSAVEKVFLQYKYVDITYYTDDDKDDDHPAGTVKSYAVNSAMTAILNNGTTVGGNSRKPSHFILSSVITNPGGTDLDAGVDSLKGINVAAGSLIDLSTAKWQGTTSHGFGSGILVIAKSASGGASDSVLCSAEPGPVYTFDITTFQTNLNTANSSGKVTNNAVIPAFLPIYALDEDYNKVSGLDFTTTGAEKFLTKLSMYSGAGSVSAINFLIDGHDPVLAGPAASDSVTLDSLGIKGVARAAAYGQLAAVPGWMQSDKSFIYGYDVDKADRTDSSLINLGGIGANPMGLRVKFNGIRRVTIQWAIGKGPNGEYTTNTVKTLDLGLLNLQTVSSIDSVTNVKAIAISGDKVGATVNRVIQFKAGAGNTIGPEQPDSIIFVKFPHLTGDAGLPATFDASKVKLSVDAGTTYYASPWVGGAGDSIAIVAPFLMDPSGTNGIYVKIEGFVNPTASDTNYMIQVATEASPVWASSSYSDGYHPSDQSLHHFFIATQATVADSFKTGIKWTSQLTKAAALNLTAGVQSDSFAVFGADRYGNIVTLVDDDNPISRGLIFKADTSVGGGSAVIKQKFHPDTTFTSRGAGMYDSLTASVKARFNTRTIGGDYANAKVYFGGLSITPAKATSAGYYMVVMDSTDVSIRDSILIKAAGTVAGSVAKISPTDTLKTSKNTEQTTALVALLKDAYGNILADSLVNFAVTTGSATFIDSNGVAILSAKTSIDVKSGADGKASVKIKTGSTGDLIVVTASPKSVPTSTVTYIITTTIVRVQGDSRIHFTALDSLVPDTLAKSLVAHVRDGDGVKKVSLVTYKTMLTLGTDNKFVAAATTDTVAYDSTMAVTSGDSVDVTFHLPKQALGSSVAYKVVVTDAFDSLTASVMKNYVIAPKRGKSKLSTEATNVADIMRLVYLVLGYATPTTVDWFGLDLNQDGAFTGDQDLVTILNIWKGTATLASAGEQQTRSAKASLSFKETDKANANLFIELENKGELNYAEFQVKYDATKYSLGEVSRTERIDQSVQVVFNNRKEEGILHIIVINLQGRSITSGSGAILSVPVEALNGKFDGNGEISLLSVGFEQNVQSELSKEVLSPKASLPKAFAMSQNYPNPFNPSTTIAYDIPEGKEVQVRLNIYNVRGQLIRTLVNEVKSEGSYQIQWDGSSNNGQKVSSGVYFYRLVAGEFNQTRKMVILK